MSGCTITSMAKINVFEFFFTLKAPSEPIRSKKFQRNIDFSLDNRLPKKLHFFRILAHCALTVMVFLQNVSVYVGSTETIE